MNTIEIKYPIGTKFTTRGKFPRVCTVVDVLRTYNFKNEPVRLEYVATHEFAGQVISGNYPQTSIDMGSPVIE